MDQADADTQAPADVDDLPGFEGLVDNGGGKGSSRKPDNMEVVFHHASHPDLYEDS